MNGKMSVVSEIRAECAVFMSEVLVVSVVHLIAVRSLTSAASFVLLLVRGGN